LLRSHEDDPFRGVMAALAIHSKLLAMKLTCSIGVR
jgi:hypothetical protein